MQSFNLYFTSIILTITNQPQNQAVFAGQTATFTVGAIGTPPLSYQWQQFQMMGGMWWEIPGATNSTYSFNSAQYLYCYGGVYPFSVIVSNGGGASIQSSNAWLTVYELPITTPSSASVFIGQNATFSVSYSTYNSSHQNDQPWPAQWQFNGTNIPGATNYSYAIINAQLTNAGSYSVFITNPEGSETSQPSPILQVLPPNAPSIQINNQLAVGSMSAIGSAQLTISGGFTNGFIFYTLDGTTPTTSSPFYAGPVTLTNPDLS